MEARGVHCRSSECPSRLVVRGNVKYRSAGSSKNTPMIQGLPGFVVREWRGG
jgi:hypothetical protein